VYTQRTTYFQEIGKGPQLRPLLEERVGRLQAQGVRASLSSGTYVMDGPTLSVSLQFDDLAALEAFAAGPLGRADPVFVSRLLPLTRQPARTDTLEVLLAAPISDRAPRYVQRTTLTPFAGKSRDVRTLALGRAGDLQAAGIRAGVSVHVTGIADGHLVTDILFEDLTGLEKLRADNHTDSDSQDYQARMSVLAPRTRQVELFQILVPFQAV
jgi:hypothetical protein